MHRVTPPRTDLAHRLRQGGLDHLLSAELDAVLGWITHAQRQQSVSLASALGDPENDPELLRRVYEQLDRVLFLDGNLQEEVAGVSDSLPEDRRRARYRRLMAAFHPDRYPDPDLAEWLTARSQAIHRAYARFRRGDVPGPKPPVRPAPAAAPAARRAPKRRIPRVSFGPGLIHLLRDRVRGIQHLEAKILGVLAILFFLPVLVLYLNQYSVPVAYDLPRSPSPTPGLEGAGDRGGARDPDAPVPALFEHGASRASLEGSLDGRDAEVMPRPLESPEVLLELLATKVDSESIAAWEIAAIEAAAMVTAARSRAESEDKTAASMNSDSGVAGAGSRSADVAIRSGVSGDDGHRPVWDIADPGHGRLGSAASAGSVDGWATEVSDDAGELLMPPEAPVLEAAAREAALLAAAARRAAEKEAVALAAAMREADALRQAMRESAALQAAAREAAERETAAREAAAVEAAAVSRAKRPADPLVSQHQARTGDARLSWVADGEREAGVITRRSNAPETVATEAEAEAEAMAIGRRRVAALLDSYQSAFKHGDIAGLMRHLGSDPRENNNGGRSWFEASFRELLDRSRWRQLRVDISSISPSGDGDWEISGYFHLRVDYMDRPTVQASGPVHYRVSNRNEGWRIDSIDY